LQIRTSRKILHLKSVSNIHKLKKKFFGLPKIEVGRPLNGAPGESRWELQLSVLQQSCRGYIAEEVHFWNDSIICHSLEVIGLLVQNG